MILVYIYNDSSGDCLTPDTRPAILKNFHYMYFALLITLMTAVSAIVISYFTGRPTEEQVFLHINISFDHATNWKNSLL